VWAAENHGGAPHLAPFGQRNLIAVRDAGPSVTTGGQRSITAVPLCG